MEKALAGNGTERKAQNEDVFFNLLGLDAMNKGKKTQKEWNMRRGFLVFMLGQR